MAGEWSFEPFNRLFCYAGSAPEPRLRQRMLYLVELPPAITTILGVSATRP